MYFDEPAPKTATVEFSMPGVLVAAPYLVRRSEEQMCLTGSARDEGRNKQGDGQRNNEPGSDTATQQACLFKGSLLIDLNDRHLGKDSVLRKS